MTDRFNRIIIAQMNYVNYIAKEKSYEHVKMLNYPDLQLKDMMDKITISLNDEHIDLYIKIVENVPSQYLRGCWANDF